MFDDFEFTPMGILRAARESLCCIICCICTGPILVLIGLFFFMAAINNSRKDRVKEYNEVVDLWTASGRAAFDNAAIALETPSIATHDFAQKTLVDTRIDSDDDVTVHQALYYELTNANMWTLAYKDKHEETVKFNTTNKDGKTSQFSQSLTIFEETDVTWRLGDCDKTKREVEEDYEYEVMERDIETRATTKTTTTKTPCSTACANRSGATWNAATLKCLEPSVASTACVKVDTASTGFAIDSTNGGPGCEPAWTFRSGVEKWTLGLNTTDTISLTLTVRSKNDPFIKAGELGWDFGLSALQKFTIGLVFFVIGGLWITCMCCFLLCVKRLIVGDDDDAPEKV
eukprot:TRINITY_DN275_c0_g1_i1.p1 TRINITY_DN275_c0_g1~~TRINITY_DN275_c0_g1_i1.p1  ORF type:complete len:344 (+),score=102.27 TRINITY_DN275_c0_g1_i1:71-1102(+)